MSIFYLDRENGNDATTNTPLGWWSVAYTGGSGMAPAASELVTGATSGSTTKLTVVVNPSSGSWVAGTAAGTMYFFGKSGAFVAEQVNCASGGSFQISGDLVYCAWQTFTNGATYSRLTGGNHELRLHKTPSPVSIGNALWTNLSREIVLSSPQTIDIDMCETAWTKNPSGDCTVTLITTATAVKQGSASMKLALDSTPQASIMQAYYALPGTLDLSSMQAVSFQLYNSAAILDSQWRIALCSDSAGATPVDFIDIPAIAHTSKWLSLNLFRNGGGNLGNNINSIALYTNSVKPSNSSFLYLDCIIACASGGINLTSLITKDGTALRDKTHDGYYTIASIAGSTISIESAPQDSSSTYRGYYGITETVETFLVQPFRMPLNTGSNGTSNLMSLPDIDYLSIYGGYDSATNLKNGDTIYDNCNGQGYGFNCGSGTDNLFIENFTLVRGYYTFAFNGSFGRANMINFVSCSKGIYFSGTDWLFQFISGNNCSEFIAAHSYVGLEIKELLLKNNNAGMTLSGNSTSMPNVRIKDLQAYNNGTVVSANTTSREHFRIYKATLDYNYRCFHMAMEATLYVKHLVESNTLNTIAYILNQGHNGRVYTDRYNNNNDLPYVFGTNSGFALMQAASAGGSGFEWLLVPASNQGNTSQHPFRLLMAKALVSANKEVTASVYVKRTGVSITSGIVCPKWQLEGIDEDVSATSPNDIDRNLVTINFTPTEAGVVEIYIWVYGAGTTYGAIFDDCSITQAD